MTKDLLIIGAGGTGIMLAEVIEDINSLKKDWNLLGFLDDDIAKQGLEINGYPVIGKLIDTKRYHNCYFIATLGSPHNFLKRETILQLELGLDRFVTIVHPDAKASKYAQIGRGTVIMPGVVIEPNVMIGNHVTVLSNSYIGHHSQIKDYVTIASSAAIGGKCVINEECYLGQNCSVKEQVNIEECCLIGMGAVVLDNVPAYNKIVGNPGKSIGKIQVAVDKDALGQSKGSDF
jgi:sugar O-acyltransferase (sialic acid O-acetyltransferase NeuD family)